MAPQIAITYTGSPVNGPLGYGWTLQGLSIITRCPYTKAIDGVAHGVDYGVGDKLCLDGQRLIQTDATGAALSTQQNDSQGLTGSTVREYRTETDMFARIRAYGTAGGAVANGPAYFKVWTKAGQIYEYGNNTNTTASSAINVSGGSLIVAWAASRISDTVGNYIDFQYTQRDVAQGSGTAAAGVISGHEWNLAEIRYTGNGTQVPTNKIVFNYTDRPATPIQDLGEAYHRGTKTISLARLSSIQTYINYPSTATSVPTTAVKVKTTNLTYEYGAITHRSRLKTLVDCVGPSQAKCMPAVTFNYADGGNDAYQPNATFAASTLSTLPMMGSYGVLVGDFNGDGRTDFIRWGVTPSDNQLWLSDGTGGFTKSTAFNLTAVQLFTSNSCYSSIAADFNGDGVTDILRVMKTNGTDGAACPTASNVLYLGSTTGSGVFTAVTVPSTIDLSSIASTLTIETDCLQPKSSSYVASCSELGDTILGMKRSAGKAFHLIDVNNDGILDIVTSTLPGYAVTTTIPSDAVQCASVVCTHVYLGSTSGTFTEATTNVANRSMYANALTYWLASSRMAYVMDANGDGMSDLNVESGLWISRGDGNFDLSTTVSGSVGCAYPLDFNGDGREDCLTTIIPATSQTLALGDGLTETQLASRFNLNTTGYELLGAGTKGTTIGVVNADFNGDGRTDILRWEDDATKNALYLSQGDGSFAQSTTFTLNSANASTQLRKSDGTYDFITGDFTGHGNVEFLRMVATIGTGETNTNQLYTKVTSTPADQLVSVKSGSGLTTSLTWVPMTNSASGTLGARYISDRATTNAATLPTFDITVPSYVVATSVADSGVGSNTVTTEYRYAGLKAAYDGRGIQSFRETRRQTPAANGANVTVATQYLQSHPYGGVASSTQTWVGTLDLASPTLVSRTTNVYCEYSVAAAQSSATATTPCPTTAVIQHPYLASTLEEGWELGTSTALPTVTTKNTFDASGDPTSIVVTRTGTALGLSQTFVRTTTNTYLADNTSGDYWILGRLQAATQQNQVPNSLASIATSAGSGKFASATTGAVLSASLSTPTFASTMISTSVTGIATLTNTGGAAIAVTTPTSSAVSGTPFAFVSSTCGISLAAGATCTVTIGFSPTTAVTSTGTLSLATAVGTQSVTLTGTGLTQPALALASCQAVASTTPTAATFSCALSNSGQSSATSVAYASTLSVSGISLSGPTSCAPGSCGAVVVTSPTAVGTYAGTLTATPNKGSVASAAFSLQVNTVASLALSACTSTITTTPTAAAMTCTVTNSGQTAASSISYASTLSGTTVSGTTAACAAGATCGTVTLTSATAAGSYSGTLTATPASGTAGSAGFALTVLTQPTLALNSCASIASTTPTASTYSCTLANTGGTAATALTYASTTSGASISGPTTCAANTTSCGTVIVTSPTAAATYTGTLTATPTPTGSAASSTYSLNVNTVATLALSGCTSTTTTTPTAAAMTCTVTNSGQTAASSISYASTLSGTTLSGTTAACAAGATCGTVTLTSATAAGSYSGTLTATPASGTAGSAGFALTVLTQPTLALNSCASIASTTPTASTYSCTLANTGGTAATALTYASTTSGASISGPTTCAANTSSCGTVIVTSPTAAATYAGTLTATPTPTGTAASSTYSLNVNTVATLALSACTSTTTTTPTAAAMTCTVTNSGQTAASSISYASTLSGTTVSGTTAACAAGATCGTVTLTSGTTAGNYGGTLTATPSAGSAASTSFSLNVLTPTALVLSSCTTSAGATPTAATYACTLSNTGQTGASVTYAVSVSGASVTGPTTCSIINTSCGTVTVTSPTAIGTYAGTLTATPSSGSGASSAFSLVVNVAPFTVVTSTGLATTFKNPNTSAVTPTASGLKTSGISGATLTTNTCASSVAAGGTCAISFKAASSDCKADNYGAYAYVTDAGGTAAGTAVNKTSTVAICP